MQQNLSHQKNERDPLGIKELKTEMLKTLGISKSSKLTFEEIFKIAYKIPQDHLPYEKFMVMFSIPIQKLLDKVDEK